MSPDPHAESDDPFGTAVEGRAASGLSAQSEPRLDRWVAEGRAMTQALGRDLQETTSAHEQARDRANPGRARVERVLRLYSEGEVDQLQARYDSATAGGDVAAADAARQALSEATGRIKAEPGFQTALKAARRSVEDAGRQRDALDLKRDRVAGLHRRGMVDARRLSVLHEAGMQEAPDMPALEADPKRPMTLEERAQRLNRAARAASLAAESDPRLAEVLRADGGGGGGVALERRTTRTDS